MKKLLYFTFSLALILFGAEAKSQQTDWPKIVTLKDNSQIKVYEPQPESLWGNILKIKSAISYLETGKTDPVFGVLWADVTTQPGNNQDVIWQSLSITNLKLPADNATNALDDMEGQIQDQVSNWNVSMSRSALDEKLKLAKAENNMAQKLNTAPPTIIYSNKPAILVFIDGEPQIQQNQEWGVDQIVNTPFTILKNSDQQYYLYGNKRWYRASQVKGPWTSVSSIPSSLSKAEKAIRESDTTQVAAADAGPAEIIVSQVPAELVQSKGEANFAPVQGTNLLYMTNTGNDVFLDVNSQKYYVLLSGRWYTAPNLSSKWTYTAADKLPAEFSQIPENSPKANVLASIAGTEEAAESVADAQVPQTAKVDRKTATASVTYDGDPQFENIEGTDLKYGVNSSGEVLQSGRTYYYVENGVWFQSQSANGPWVVATQRPVGIENIPPGYPVYNLKYVHIYDVYPDYVYMGYTPGYLGNYIYGPTIVYGTGYYYKPWRGRYYYPRPVTWGFNMRYSPWVGWGFGFDSWNGWFLNINFGLSFRRPVIWGGWWGPTIYRPPYYRSYPSYYGRTIGYNSYRYTPYRYNNVYHYRRDVVTTDRLYRPSVFDRRYASSGRPNTYGYNNRPGNNYGRSGNVNGGRYDNSNRNNPGSRPTYGYNGNRQPNNGGGTYERGNNNNGRMPNGGGDYNSNRFPNSGRNDNFGNRLPNGGGNNNYENRLPNAGGNNSYGNRLPNSESNGGRRSPDANDNNNRLPNSAGENNQPYRRPNTTPQSPSGIENNDRRLNNFPQRQSNDAPLMQRPSERVLTSPGQRPQRMPERQQPVEVPQPSRQAPPSGNNQFGGQRPERVYQPSGSGGGERVRPQNFGGNRGGEGGFRSEGGGREGRRRGE